MSTRATYEIEGRTFYIHHDGYPEGAASYLYNMVDALTNVDAKGEELDIFGHRMRRGGLEFAFIRGNGNAEPTENHHAHGDTEFRYTVTRSDGEPMLRAKERVGDWSKPTWQTFFFGPLAEFINLHVESGLFQNMTNQGQGVIYATINQRFPKKVFCTVDEALNAVEGLNNRANKYKEDNPNRASYASDARDMLDAVNGYMSTIRQQVAAQ